MLSTIRTYKIFFDLSFVFFSILSKCSLCIITQGFWWRIPFLQNTVSNGHTNWSINASRMISHQIYLHIMDWLENPKFRNEMKWFACETQSRKSIICTHIGSYSIFLSPTRLRSPFDDFTSNPIFLSLTFRILDGKMLLV